MTAMLDWPQRTETVLWKLYDRDFNLLGDLMVSGHQAPQITNDTSRSIRRAVQRIEILPRPMYDVDRSHYYADDIDTLSTIVRPWWHFADGTEYPLGVFVWGDDSTVQRSSGSTKVGALTDLCTDLDQPIDNSIGYGAGSVASDAILDVAGDLLNLNTDGIDNNPYAVFGVAVGWVAGRDTYLTVLDGLCKNAGFLPPYFDNNGLLRCRYAPDLTIADPDFVYGSGSSVVPGSAVFSNDLLTAPNRYIIVSGNTDSEIVGIFDVPDTAPNSYVNTGRRRRKTDTVQGISTTAQANAAAAAAYASDHSSYQWLAFDSRVNPMHDTWDIIEYDGLTYREVSWTMNCKAGGIMSHSVRGTY